jgi:hypothetical protein
MTSKKPRIRSLGFALNAKEYIIMQPIDFSQRFQKLFFRAAEKNQTFTTFLSQFSFGKNEETHKLENPQGSIK